MLAMVVNDDAHILTPRGDLSSIASMLAPTGGRRAVITNNLTLREDLAILSLPYSAPSNNKPGAGHVAVNCFT